MAFFVVFACERSYFRFGKFANGFLQEELVVGECEVHAHRYFSAEKERRRDLTQRSQSTQRAQRGTPAGCQRYEMCAGEIQARAARTRSKVVAKSSGKTRVSPVTDMKLASPTQRGSAWRCKWPAIPAPAARPR